MKLDVYTLKDRIKLKQWLEFALCKKDNEDEELKSVIDRLNREIAYLEESKAKREQAYKEKTSQIEPEGLEEFKKKQEEKEQRFQELKSTDHSDAIFYLKKSGKAFDDETLAYSDDCEFNGYKKQIDRLLDYCIEIIHRIPDVSDYEFFNDEIDEWYFNKGTVEPRYFFPSECFLLKFGEDIIEYSETNGQGTSFDIKYCKDVKAYGARFGHNEKMTLLKVIDIDKVSI